MLASELPGVVNLHLDATEHGDDLVFLHAVREGPANRSYGLAVAKLAGVPATVITAARRYLAELESQRDAHHARAPSPQAALPFDAPAPSSRAGLLRATGPAAGAAGDAGTRCAVATRCPCAGL